VIVANVNNHYSQRAVGVVIFILAVLGWFVYVILENRRSTRQIVDSFLSAPNRKQAPDDEVFEGPRLDKWLGFALVLMTLVAISLPLYWLNEQSRQTGAIRGFDNRTYGRGEKLFGAEHNGFNCAQCHGPKGGGGIAQKYVPEYNEDGTPKIDPETKKQMQKKVIWKAPRINNVALRYRPDQIRNVLIYGRGQAKNNPMPAWGLAGGGPGNPQQISDLVSLLTYWSIEGDENAKKAYDTEWAASQNQAKAYEKGVAAAAEAAKKDSTALFNETRKGAADTLKSADKDLAEKKAAVATAKATGDEVKIDAAEKEFEDKQKAVADAKAIVELSDGALLFNLNCARCHTNGYSYGEPKAVAGGYYGPSLRESSLKNQFPDASSQIDFVTNGAPDGGAYGTGGVNHWSGGGMPYFANVLTKEQIEAIITYERGLK
jgi:mono/diheme cytochrome c family protein